MVDNDRGLRPPSDDGRQLTYATLEQLWTGAQPLVVPIPGEPPCELRFDPAGDLLSLVTAYARPEPDLARLRNVEFTAMVVDGNDTAEVSVRVAGNVQGAYGLLATIARELQTRGASLAAAVATGLERHGRVLEPREPLSTEKEIGILGELLFLEYLVEELGAEAAVGSWQGPLSEEHDFVFDGVHVEVKTTSSESRRHVIHGLSQLLPLDGVDLQLLSLQVTRCPAELGISLPGLIARLRRLLGGAVVAFDGCLVGQGWREEDDLYPTSWRLRSKPTTFKVGGSFPAITRKPLGTVVPNLNLVSNVMYTVDVTDLPSADDPPQPLPGFVT